MEYDDLDTFRELSFQGFSALEPVIEFACCGCGLCKTLCPEHAITMTDGAPVLTGACVRCGLCYQGCPRTFFPAKSVRQRWFGRERTPLQKRLGVYLDRFTSRSLDDRIFEGGTTGGTTTALLYHLLQTRAVDAILHVGCQHQENFICNHPKIIVSTQPAETLRGQHSKLQVAPLLSELERISTFKRTAVLGLPCHISALRKLQAVHEDQTLRNKFPRLSREAERLVGSVRFMISLNCFGSLKHGAIDRIYAHFGVQERDLIKFAEISKKSLYQRLNEDKDYFWYSSDCMMTRDGREHGFRYGDFVEEMHMGCNVCPSLLVCKEADASIGMVASEIRKNEFGYNFVTVRNTELQQIFQHMVETKRLLRRPMLDGKGRLIRLIAERAIPVKDILHQREFVQRGEWIKKASNPYAHSTPGFSKKIMGLQRFLFFQIIKDRLFRQPAYNALREGGKHYPVNLEK